MGAGDRQPEVREFLDEFGRLFDAEDYFICGRTVEGTSSGVVS